MTTKRRLQWRYRPCLGGEREPGVRSFAEKEVVYEGDERRDIQLAYAVTVHKSQGSEYDMVILVLLPSQRMMLQRNLLYTGVTRAGKRTILITMGGALQTAVRSHKTAGRCSMLLPLLAGEARE